MTRLAQRDIIIAMSQMKNNLKWIFAVLVLAVVMPLCSVIFLGPKKAEITNIEVMAEDDVISSVKAEYMGYEVDDENDAWQLLESLKNTFGYSSARESFGFEGQSKTAAGTIYRFSQYQDGLRVYSSHLDISVGSDNKVQSITGKYYFNLTFDQDASYSINQAKTEMVKLYGGEAILEEEVYYKDGDAAYKVYILNVVSNQSSRRVFVSARTGVVIKSEITTSAVRDSLPSTLNYNVENVGVTETNLQNQTVVLNVDKYTPKSGGQSFYLLGNHERRIYVVDGQNVESASGYKYIDSTNGIFTDKVAVQAYEYLMKCYDYYLEGSFGESIEGMYNFFNKRITLIGIVHYGQQYQNAAFWLPYTNSLTGYFFFGDGGGITTNYVKALDVVGHEYQHSVNNAKAGLGGVGQEGAINEAISDIFGAVIEGKDIATSIDFWRLGEDVYRGNGFMRDFSNPSLTGDVSHYSQVKFLSSDKEASESNDNGYVHSNCTLLTYAAYLMYKSDPAFFTTENITKLWYTTLCMLLEQETFVTFANDMYQAAQNLGWSDDKVQAVYNAFSSVGIPGFESNKIWGGCYLTTFEGAGTDLSPYLIKSVDDLASMMYYVNDEESDIGYLMATYQITDDIKLPSNEPWDGIGTLSRPFNGTFVGGGNTISGLNLNNSQQVYNGLFCYVGPNGYISDLILEGNTQSTAQYTGAAVGRLEGMISSVGSKMSISGKNVGGLVGLLINRQGGQSMASCTFSGELDGDIVGGLVSQFVTEKNPDKQLHMVSSISSSYALGQLSGKVVGGLVGQANGLMLINDISMATITAKPGAQALGGFVGQLYFLNPLAEIDSVSTHIVNYFISCLSTASFNLDNGGLVGSIYGQNLGRATDGKIYIEKTTIKEREGIDYASGGLDQWNIKAVDLRTSSDEAFEGDFDFDNPTFYKDGSVFTWLDNNDAFNMTVDFTSESGQMPGFTDLSTWNLGYTVSLQGKGTKTSPYLISSAAQLISMSNLVMSDNAEYGGAYYTLTCDIDLAGNVWAGIGGSISIYQGGQLQQTTLYPFMGTFDGGGHTIRNLTSVGLYSGQILSTSGEDFVTINYSAGLFGLTASYGGLTPTIKNLTIENANVRGGRAGALVSVAYGAINLENVCVAGGHISSSYVAGGLISTMYGISGSQTTSSIKNCSVSASVSGRIAGGAIGYATNQSGTSGSIEVVNLLVQGQVLAYGYDLEAVSDGGDFTYYNPIGGGVFGILMARQTDIINTMVFADIISYSENPDLGGFIGLVGAKDSFSGSQININIVAGKFVGSANYIFDGSSSSAGAILGANHVQSGANINLAVDEKTYTNNSSKAIGQNVMDAVITDNCHPTTSESRLGEGDFDIYNEQYYQNEKYFDLDNAWEQEQTDRMYYTVVLKDWDETILKTYTLKIGEEIDAATLPTPVRGDTVNLIFTFRDWSQPLTNIHCSMTVYAEYTVAPRQYQVEYYAGGKLISTASVEYGKTIPQDVEAPEKSGNFFVNYTFVRWGENGLRVGGNIKVEAIYKMHLTTGSIVLIVLAALVVISVGGYFFLRKR